MFHRRRSRTPGLRTLGFTLIELAIVLGITGLLFTGLWRLLSNGNQQLRDQATASQQQQLITAISTYLATTDGQNWMGTALGTAGPTPFSASLPLPPSTAAAGTTGVGGCAAVIATKSANLIDLCTILPPGFSGAEGWTAAQSPSPTVNPYGQSYNVHVLATTLTGIAPQSFSFMIVTSGGDVISDTDGGRISSMIGGDGGFIYSNNVCGSVPSVSVWACGAYGAWAQNITANYGFAAGTSGTVASRTFYSPTQNSLQPWLARQPMTGDTATYGYNTMSWDLFMGQTPTAVPFNINLTPFTPAGTGGNINMGGITAGIPGSGAETPALTGGGNLNMSGGTINMVNAAAATVTGGNTVNGGINMQGGTINLVNATAPTTGGGDINLQGGLINDVSTNPAVSINVPGGTPLDNGNASPEPTALITVGTGCSQTGGIAGLTQSTWCAPGIQVAGDEYINGQLTANSLYAQTFIYQSSDMRLKTNIHTLKNPLDGVMELNPVDFRFKASGQESLGVIAQEVEKIYPQLVEQRSDGMKVVNYEGLIAPLIGAVQELKKENDDLREQLRAQAIRQNVLEDELKNSPTSR
jgi:type II secretory pathway pseudopilin PulG